MVRHLREQVALELHPISNSLESPHRRKEPRLLGPPSACPTRSPGGVFGPGGAMKGDNVK